MADYYVDSVDGDDLHDGLSEAQAWQNLSKVEATSVAAGSTYT